MEEVIGQTVAGPVTTTGRATPPVLVTVVPSPPSSVGDDVPLPRPLEWGRVSLKRMGHKTPCTISQHKTLGFCLVTLITVRGRLLVPVLPQCLQREVEDGDTLL